MNDIKIKFYKYISWLSYELTGIREKLLPLEDQILSSEKLFLTTVGSVFRTLARFYPEPMLALLLEKITAILNAATTNYNILALYSITSSFEFITASYYNIFKSF
jgi:hypothetical protein